MRAELGGFEQDEGGDGRAARQMFELLAGSGWLRNSLPMQTHGQQRVSLMRETDEKALIIAAADFRFRGRNGSIGLVCAFRS